jgi:hypothetical protein
MENLEYFYNPVITPGIIAIAFMCCVLYRLTHKLSEPIRGIILSLSVALMVMGMLVLAAETTQGVTITYGLGF